MTHQRIISFATGALSLSLLALLSACQSTTVSTASAVQLPSRFEHTATHRATEQQTDISRWWQQWNDPVLSALIEQGLQQSHDMRMAQSRLQEARANSRLAQADKGATVGASANATRTDAHVRNPLGAQSQAALTAFPPTASLAKDRFSFNSEGLSAGLNASWEPDIFGQKRSDADAAHYAAMGAQEQLYGTQMLVTSDIADNYLQARAAQTRLQTANSNIATLQRLLQYVQGRFNAGHASAYEVQQVQTQLSAARAQQSTIAAQYAAYVRNIAVLTAQTPQGFVLPPSTVDVLGKQPAAPAGYTPQGLLERRPDIRANAAQVHALAAKLASAKADLLPRFSIRFLGQGSMSIEGSNSLKGWASLLSLDIQVPIFTNGRIQANIAAADARLQTALLQYDKTLLQALGEVDSAYQTYTALTQQEILLQTAHQQAVQQAHGAQALFKHGNKTLDEALRAQMNVYDMRNNLTQSQLARAQTLLGLYKALGGGWDAQKNAATPTHAEKTSAELERTQAAQPSVKQP